MDEGSPNNISPRNFENSTWRLCPPYGLATSLPMADKSKSFFYQGVFIPWNSKWIILWPGSYMAIFGLEEAFWPILWLEKVIFKEFFNTLKSKLLVVAYELKTFPKPLLNRSFRVKGFRNWHRGAFWRLKRLFSTKI